MGRNSWIRTAGPCRIGRHAGSSHLSSGGGPASAPGGCPAKLNCRSRKKRSRLDALPGYWRILIADKGHALLRGEGSFPYREDTATARGRAPARAWHGGERPDRLPDREKAMLLGTPGRLAFD